MERSKKYFDEIANSWDGMQQEFFSEKVREVAYQLAGVQVGNKAADIGAGTGYVTEGLIERDVDVIAIDQSSGMLEILKSKMVNKYGANVSIKCIQGDSDNLPLEDNSVDYVFANMYLHHVVLPETAIKEMYRILKKDGKLVITDLDTHTYDFLIKEQHDIWLGFDRGNILTLLNNAGFAESMISSVGSECSAESLCKCDSAVISIFAAVGKK